MHMVRYYAAYSNRKRGELVEDREALAAGEDPLPAPLPDDDALLPPDLSFEEAPTPSPPVSAEALRRQSWARLLRKVFEIDPLLCPRCRVEMAVVACITDPAVIDAILRHRREQGFVSPFEARAPPATHRARGEATPHTLNHTARTLAVYASQHAVTRDHARLASGCVASLAGRDWIPAGLRMGFRQVMNPPHPGLSWRTENSNRTCGMSWHAARSPTAATGDANHGARFTAVTQPVTIGVRPSTEAGDPMNLKQRYNFARLLLFFGGLLSCAWAIVSLLDLFDLVSETSHGWRVIRAFGPLGLGGVILGGVLCGWDLPSLKKQVEGERE